MTLRTKSNRQSNVTFSCTEQLVAGRARMLVPKLRRPSHLPGNLVAVAILVPVSGDVNTNLGAFADDSWTVAADVPATTSTFAGRAALLTEPTADGVARAASALDDEDEDEEDDDYDDDDLDEEDDEDLEDVDEEEFAEDLDDEDDELDDDLDDVDDEDDEDEDEE